MVAHDEIKRGHNPQGRRYVFWALTIFFEGPSSLIRSSPPRESSLPEKHGTQKERGKEE